MTADFYQVKLDDAHNAKADAIAAGLVAQAVLSKFADQLPDNVVDLHNQQVIWADEIEASFVKFLQGAGKPEARPNFGWPLKLGAAQVVASGKE